jgi:hypothetical protein
LRACGARLEHLTWATTHHGPLRMRARSRIQPRVEPLTMKSLEEAELRMAAEIAAAIAKGRGQFFDQEAAALALCQAARAPGLLRPVG